MAGFRRSVVLIVVVGMLACTREQEIIRSAGSQDNKGAAGETNPISPEVHPQSGADHQSEADKIETFENEAAEAEEPVTETAELEDAEAETVLRRMAEFYQQARSLTVECEHVITMQIRGTENTVTSNREIAAERPNRLMIRSTGEMPTPDIYQNGDSLVMHMGTLASYTKVEAYESFTDLLGNPMLFGGGITAPMILHLLSDDPYEALMQGVEERQYLGQEEVNGENVHHLRFIQDQLDWDAWISAEGEPLLKQVVTDMSKTLGAFAQGDQATPKMTLTETYRKWSINSPINDESFVFTPPEGAEQVDHFFEGMFGEEEPSPLVGKAAPPVDLELLDGGRFRLADHTGESIVLLDFWAAWCGPCVEEMPLLGEIADEYRDKGVVFYAVNQGEDPETIRQFLDQEDLDVTVALDRDGEVGDLYDAQSLPTLAIIDKAGVVQAVHLGYSPAIKTTLRQELDDLLAGKNLAEESAKARKSSKTASEPFGPEKGWAAGGRSTVKIPAGPEVPTWETYAETERRYLTRTILEPYKTLRPEKDVHDPTTDQVERFFRMYIDHSVLGSGSHLHYQLWEKGHKLADGGCTDPMFTFCFGSFLQSQGHLEESEKHLRYAYDNFPDRTYDISYRFWAANRLSVVLRDLGRSKELKALAPEALALLIPAVTGGTYLPDEQRVLFWHIEGFLSNSPLQELQPIVDELSNRDDVDQWLKHMMSGYVDVRLAWQARGGGWANTVTNDGWKEFAKDMKRAYEHLNQAWLMNPEAPESAEKMIEVAMAGHTPHNETPQFWFNRAVTAQIDYLPAYQKLRWALMPRWGGSHRAMYDLGREALNTGRFDTWAPYELFNIVTVIVDEIDTNESVYQRPGIYEDLLKMCDGYAAEGSRSPNPNWFRALKVALAVKCEKWSDAREFLGTQTQDSIQTDPFVRLGLRTDVTLGEIYARTGEMAGKHALAEKLIAEARLEEAESHYRTLIDRADGQLLVTTYFRGRLSSLERDRKFTVGEWTNILPNERLDGWLVKSGNWSVDEQGRLTGESVTTGLELYCRQSFGARFELRGEAEFLTSPFNRFNIGVYFGQQSNTLHNSIRFYRYQGYIGRFEAPDTDPLEKKDVTVNAVNRFHIQRWDNTLSVSFNDEPVMTNLVIGSSGPLSNEVFGLGGRYWYDGAKICFKQLEIRQLTDPPQDPDEAKKL